MQFKNSRYQHGLGNKYLQQQGHFLYDMAGLHFTMDDEPPCAEPHVGWCVAEGEKPATRLDGI